MNKIEFIDKITEELLNRGYDKDGIDEFWQRDSETANLDEGSIIDFIYAKFVKGK